MENKECPICFEPCGKDTLVTECCHKHFHTSCHAKCMKVNVSCPLCRTITIQIETEEVPVKINSCRCPSKTFWCFWFVVIFVMGAVAALVYCMATKNFNFQANEASNITGAYRGRG